MAKGGSCGTTLLTHLAAFEPLTKTAQLIANPQPQAVVFAALAHALPGLVHCACMPCARVFAKRIDGFHARTCARPCWQRSGCLVVVGIRHQLNT